MLEDSVEAINALNTQIQAAQDELKTLAAAVAKTKMEATAAAIKSAQSELAAMRLKPDPKFKLGKLRDPVAKASKVMANAQILTSTLVAAGQTVLGTITDLGISGEKGQPLVDVLAAAREANPDANIPDEKAFLAGVKKAWQPPKGAMGAVKGFLSSMGIGSGPELFGLKAQAFAEDLMKSSIDELTTFLSGNAAEDALEPSNDEPVAQLDDQMAAAGLTPEVMKGEEGGGEGGEEGGGTKKWSELSAAYLKAVDDQAVCKKFLDALKGDKKFTDAVTDLINLEESLYRRSLSSLLFEAIEFDVLKGAAAAAAEEEGAQIKLAQGLAKVLADQGVEVDNVPSDKETAEDPNAPVSDEEAAAEQDQANAELQQAVQDEAGENQSPTSAALGAIDAWVAGLSATSQKSLQAKKRVDGLKQYVQLSLDGAAKAVEKQVAKAIQKWRGEHEETLNKSKRFAAKNFDALEKLVPQLAGAMLKKANEASVTLTVATIEKSVYSYLDKKYLSDSDDLLTEHLIQNNKSGETYLEGTSYTEDDMVRYRWLKMAGLGK